MLIWEMKENNRQEMMLMWEMKENNIQESRETEAIHKKTSQVPSAFSWLSLCFLVENLVDYYTLFGVVKHKMIKGGKILSN